MSVTSFYELVACVDSQVLLELWRRTFRDYGPHHSAVVRDHGTVDWLSWSIRESGNLHRPPPEIAGLALQRIVDRHAFIDCNHRTGWLVCQTLMELGGFQLALPTEEIVAFVKSIDTLQLTEVKVVEWVGRAFLPLG